jgi:hypothetical protein
VADNNRRGVEPSFTHGGKKCGLRITDCEMYSPQPAIRNSQFGSMAPRPIAYPHFLLRSYRGRSSSNLGEEMWIAECGLRIGSGQTDAKSRIADSGFSWSVVDPEAQLA